MLGNGGYNDDVGGDDEDYHGVDNDDEEFYDDGVNVTVHDVMKVMKLSK